MNDAELQSYCYEWVMWCSTRKFYMAPVSKNILARMQPSKSGREPNGRNDPEMQYFNMAIHTLADMPEHREGFASFKLFYMSETECLKRSIEALKINRSTYYRRRDAFTRKAYSMANSLKAAAIRLFDEEMEAQKHVAEKRGKIAISRRDK